MDDLGGFVSDADMSLAPMAGLGWDVDRVSWRDAGADWDAYDLVYICTPWDYQQDVAAFIAVLERIERSSATLVNGLSLVHWNLQKTYLRELESGGAAIVPSLWCEDFNRRDVASWFVAHASDKLVIKPVVGANADDTFVLTNPVSKGLLRTLETTFTNRAFFVQPFLDSIETEGEYSLFFFGGDYSHAILKKPEPGDFRSQEEHGAEILGTAAPDDLIETARSIVALVEPQPVYLRADFIRGRDGRLLLMELELIEPSLYFRTDPASAERFARALVASI